MPLKHEGCGETGGKPCSSTCSTSRLDPSTVPLTAHTTGLLPPPLELAHLSPERVLLALPTKASLWRLSSNLPSTSIYLLKYTLSRPLTGRCSIKFFPSMPRIWLVLSQSPPLLWVLLSLSLGDTSSPLTIPKTSSWLSSYLTQLMPPCGSWEELPCCCMSSPPHPSLFLLLCSNWSAQGSCFFLSRVCTHSFFPTIT